MEVALVGLKYSGKSTVFDLLAGGEGTQPAGGTGPRRAALKVPDLRLDALAELLKPKKKTHVGISVVDLPPGTERRSARAGSAGDPYTEARAADGLILVLRAFESPQAPHPEGSIDPSKDMKALISELILADLVVLEGRLERIEKMLKVGRKPENPLEVPTLERCKAALENENPLSGLELSRDEVKLLSGFAPMTLKPALAVLNVGEKDPGAAGAIASRDQITTEFIENFPDTKAIAVCAPLEMELGGMPSEDAAEFMEAEGIGKLGDEVILESLPDVCGRITFYTVIRDEARAWSVSRGSTAAEAAGAVHTDMQRGFIKAEVIGWRELIECGSIAAAREKGLLQIEGRDYEVRDGDVITVKFAV